MKLSRIFATVFLAGFVIPAFAMLPPSYLSVKKWKHCVSSYKKDKAEFYCLPDKKPKDCPHHSWKQLTEMSNLPLCPTDESGSGSTGPGMGSTGPGTGSTGQGMGSTGPSTGSTSPAGTPPPPGSSNPQ